MVGDKCKTTKEKALALSLTADMWTSMNMDAYLAVACHFITEEASISHTVACTSFL